MEKIEMTRKIDEMGRILLPKQLMQTMSWEEKDTISLETDIDRNAIIMKRANQKCIYCGEEEGLKEYRGRNICEKCQKEIGAL